jgi:hypothetical protein
MPSINKLINYNLATSVDTGGGGVNPKNLLFYGNRGSYSSGSATWNDLSGNGNHAYVSGSNLVPTGSLGFVFNGTTNYLEWPTFEGFTTSSCVDGGYTIQMTFQPDTATVLTGSYDTTAMWDSGFGYVGGQGLMGIYLNDGLNPSGAPTQGELITSAGVRGFYVYGAPELLNPIQNVAWSFVQDTDPLQGPMRWNYYIPTFQKASFTNGNLVTTNSGKIPIRSFGKLIYASTGLTGQLNPQNLFYNPYKGIVRDILIYNRALTEEEIYRNSLALNSINASY